MVVIRSGPEPSSPEQTEARREDRRAIRAGLEDGRCEAGASINRGCGLLRNALADDVDQRTSTHAGGSIVGGAGVGPMVILGAELDALTAAISRDQAELLHPVMPMASDRCAGLQAQQRDLHSLLLAAAQGQSQRAPLHGIPG